MSIVNLSMQTVDLSHIRHFEVLHTGVTLITPGPWFCARRLTGTPKWNRAVINVIIVAPVLFPLWHVTMSAAKMRPFLKV